MCCLGRYKGVILLLGTSLLRSHFIFFLSASTEAFIWSHIRQCGCLRPVRLYFHLENTFSVWRVADDGDSEGEGKIPHLAGMLFSPHTSSGAELSIPYTSGKISSSVSCWQMLKFCVGFRSAQWNWYQVLWKCWSSGKCVVYYSTHLVTPAVAGHLRGKRAHKVWALRAGITPNCRVKINPPAPPTPCFKVHILYYLRNCEVVQLSERRPTFPEAFLHHLCLIYQCLRLPLQHIYPVLSGDSTVKTVLLSGCSLSPSWPNTLACLFFSPFFFSSRAWGRYRSFHWA